VFHNCLLNPVFLLFIDNAASACPLRTVGILNFIMTESYLAAGFRKKLRNYAVFYPVIS